MAKEAQLHLDMAHARQSDGINVIFDKNSPPSSHIRSRSRSRSAASSSDSSAHKGRMHPQKHERSSSTSSSSSSSRARSRSYPRCRRPSSRCRCDDHHKYGRSYFRRSPSRRERAHSRSYSRSPSLDRSSRRSHYRSHRRSISRSLSKSLRYRNSESKYGHKVSSSRSHRSRSRSRSTGHSIRLSVQENQELLVAAKDDVEELLSAENLQLPECVQPVLSESKESSPEPDIWVRPSPEKKSLQSDDEEQDEDSSLQLSPKRGFISFSINNSVAKPTVTAPFCAKVTPRVDTYESRKPYGHWIPVKSCKKSRKRTSVKSR